MRSIKIDGGYFLRLEKGEEIIGSLTDFADKNNIQGAGISGIGALEEVKLGYYDREQKRYLDKTFYEVYEMLSLTGNIGRFEGQTVIHAHCTIGTSDYRVFGGHLFSGIVAVTGEIYVRVISQPLTRLVDNEFNLKLLAF
jgi:predicted DNA-binding protein with PD1-like motif